MALQDEDGTVHVLKMDILAWRFVSSKEYDDFITKNLTDKTRVALLHTRGASQGTPRDMANNHPLYAGCGAVIHNGAIKNDHQLFGQLHLDRKADVDTDIIRAIVDKFGITTEAVNNLNRMSGSMASAAVHPNYPGKVLIMRSGAPLTLGSTKDMLMFASEKNTLHRAMRPCVERFGIPFQVHSSWTAFSPFPDHTAWILGDKGKEGHYHCKTLDGTYHEPWRRTYEDYGIRQERWNRESEAAKFRVEVEIEEKDKKKRKGKNHMAAPVEPVEAYCPNCKRDWVVPSGGDPYKFVCTKNNPNPGCGQRLAHKPKR